MKDIVIDTNVAIKLASPPDEQYRDFIKWLFSFDANNPLNNAYLVVSEKLLREYCKSNNGCIKASSIGVIINITLRQSRQIKISQQEINIFKTKHYTSNIKRRLTCNTEDREHIPVVLLSNRKMLLSEDERFLSDLLIFTKFRDLVKLGRSPKDLKYI